MARELRSVRTRHDDPDIPDSVKPDDLDRVARNELKTLTKENAEWVARHLVMAATLIDDDPTRAHQHALSAARRAGRIGVVRETLAITAYETGDYALALRELRTYRRITGSNDQLPLMVDSERGVGRPERALELGRTVDRASLSPAVRVALSIAMSGARLDLGQSDMALAELQIPELDPNKAFEWSPELFAAYAEVLGELERSDEAAVWRKRAIVAAEVLDERNGVFESETMDVYEEELDGDEEDLDDEQLGDDELDGDEKELDGDAEERDDEQLGDELDGDHDSVYEDRSAGVEAVVDMQGADDESGDAEGVAETASEASVGVPPVSDEDDLSEAGEPVAVSANDASYVDESEGDLSDVELSDEVERDTDDSDVEQGDVELSGVDESGVDESGVDESGVDESGVDESGDDVSEDDLRDVRDRDAEGSVVDAAGEKDERRAEKED
jgi:23S rRNA pseudouridine2605 synthase